MKEKDNTVKTKEKDTSSVSSPKQSTSSKIKEADKKQRGKLRGLIISLSIVGALLLGMTTLWLVNMNTVLTYASSLEDIYQKNYYELYDNITNIETKTSKVLAGGDEDYTIKLLNEITKNSSAASANLNSLPVSVGGAQETLTFINQVGGYCTSLITSISRGESITSKQMETLGSILEAIKSIRQNMSGLSSSLSGGYSILSSSVDINGDFNLLSSDLQGGEQVEYPSMIYDGPFSESTTNPTVKGLVGEDVSSETAESNLKNLLGNVTDCKYSGKSEGKFVTYDFSLKTDQDVNLYAQVTSVGGHLLSLSGYTSSSTTVISTSIARQKAIAFAEKAVGGNLEVVWEDKLSGYAYYNLAPIENNIVLYPDLVKVKIDLSSGGIVGFEASSYFTNHTSRTLGTATYSISDAQAKIDGTYEIKKQRLVLAPLDFNREVLCFEFEGVRDGVTYYFYFNANSGSLENILRVISTTDGTKLF